MRATRILALGLLLACGPSQPDEGTSPVTGAPTATAPAATASHPEATGTAPGPTASAPGPTASAPGPTASAPPSPSAAPTAPAGTSHPTPTAAGTAAPGAIVADVIGVATTLAQGGYTFNVTVSSPDTGCDQYADWWEVLSPDGALLYRRVLDHSHVDDQPFTRSGGPVDVAPGDEVIVRAHMNVAGYGGAALRGTVRDGIASPAGIDASFHPELAQSQPLPTSCAF